MHFRDVKMSNFAAPGAVAALDLGSRRIGVAVCDLGRVAAYPLGVVERASFERDVRAILKLLAGREVAEVVIGLPLLMNAAEGTGAHRARTFGQRLAARTGWNVSFQDERLSTREARERIREARGRVRPDCHLDAQAAAIILQRWLESHDRETT
ncbi:MAG: Holliday junction resolvase RuvX [Deltaproteobacteria bacterium]|jgi:putative Holliday junction resolvase|nr:Holliday junction resolvase RuvX [Deltaproteobacteria bacterium]